MSQYGKELQMFIMGEIRTDGWKSSWRIGEERRRSEEMGKRVFVAAPQIKARQERKPRVVISPARRCEFDFCIAKIRRCNKTGRCDAHPLKRPPMKTGYQCPACDGAVRKTKFGLCKGCQAKYRRLIEQTQVKICVEKDFRYLLNTNSVYANCPKHSRAERTAKEVIRQKTARLELARAA